MRSQHRKIKRKWYQNKKVWIGILIAIAIIIGINGLNDSSSSYSDIKESHSKTRKTNSNKQASDSSKKESSKKNNKKKSTEKTASKPKLPTEYSSALSSAKTYSNLMHMSKKGIFDQLTSEYADKFSPEAAQYAVDNIKTDWNDNALKSANTYQKDMNMSPEGIRDQLTSDYGGKFTADEADFAVKHLQ